MGKTHTPTYRVEYKENGEPQSEAWPKEAGRANEKNLIKWRDLANKSRVRGGVNYHLSQAAGVLLQVGDARIVLQRTGEVVAEVKQPMFEVVPSN